MIWIKLILIFTFALILYQDVKERMVLWFLYPLVGVCSFILYAMQTNGTLVFFNSLLNLGFVGTLLLGAYLYNRMVLRLDF